eukprot:CAMPEP_0181320644 /NCGR_PEP_ID=MMETSP1101-20121128/18239_1 /TAXON_ID=46948 /ORGANISM="Rhodomonas abbreviata, Strain Caron Lab Isolate" /LENGTH=193 /DNA_ID=CAMNT_0023428373 /DNA_START=45 /DNA_END=626 /DNA_ORIENTATION=-
MLFSSKNLSLFAAFIILCLPGGNAFAPSFTRALPLRASSAASCVRMRAPGIFSLKASAEEKSTKTKTLFERIGGEAALDAAVNSFYDRLVVDAELAKFFEGADVKALRGHQKAFMRIAFTGIPEDLDVANLMLTKHARLFEMGLNGDSFDATAGHLVGSLQDLDVPEDLIGEVVAIVGPLRAVFEQGAAAAKK